jgi:hypothetical protein
MNSFDKAVNKKFNNLIAKNSQDKDITNDKLRKFKVTARAIVREERRDLKPNDNPKSLYSKTWKAAKKYINLK